MRTNRYFYHTFLIIILLSMTNACTSLKDHTESASPWQLVDDFEHPESIENWIKLDTDNNTQPYVTNPQVTEIRKEQGTDNHFLIKKPAAEGVVGNRKAMTITPLPIPVEVGQTFTFYSRIKVEYFPNNHSFGLSNLSQSEIATQHYNAFEPMIRVTDKYESNGYKNDGTLMVMGDNKSYHKINQPLTGLAAQPLSTKNWYELWYVINNAAEAQGGQSYDLYLRGGEFAQQTKVFEHAKFRMKRAQPLIHFMTISNTGSAKKPYGNGGLMYDDIYMAKGLVLTTP